MTIGTVARRTPDRRPLLPGRDGDAGRPPAPDAGFGYTVISDLDSWGIEHGNDAPGCAPVHRARRTTPAWIGDDVTNDHADAIGSFSGDSGGVSGERQLHHDRGRSDPRLRRAPATNDDHGIYVEESYVPDPRQPDRQQRRSGIQLYPQAIDTMIRGNVIVDNGEGSLRDQWLANVRRNIVDDNVIADSNVLYNALCLWSWRSGRHGQRRTRKLHRGRRLRQRGQSGGDPVRPLRLRARGERAREARFC